MMELLETQKHMESFPCKTGDYTASAEKKRL